VTLGGDSPAGWLRLRSSDGDAREIGGRRLVVAVDGAASARALPPNGSCASLETAAILERLARCSSSVMTLASSRASVAASSVWVVWPAAGRARAILIPPRHGTGGRCCRWRPLRACGLKGLRGIAGCGQRKGDLQQCPGMRQVVGDARQNPPNRRDGRAPQPADASRSLARQVSGDGFRARLEPGSW
jgi:hypothetical protein